MKKKNKMWNCVFFGGPLANKSIERVRPRIFYRKFQNGRCIYYKCTKTLQENKVKYYEVYKDECAVTTMLKQMFRSEK